LDFYELIFYFAAGLGFLVAFNLGANDVANSMASAVGAKAITMRQAITIAAVLNFIGAVFLGSRVTATISSGIVDPASISDPHALTLGLCSALLAAVFWVLFSTMVSLPVSSTHSVVGAMLGFGLVAAGPGSVHWATLITIALSWVVSPFIAAAISFGLYKLILRTIQTGPGQMKQLMHWAPIWLAVIAGVVAYSFLYHTNIGEELALSGPAALGASLAIALLVWLAGRAMRNHLPKLKHEHPDPVEERFRRLQVFTSCFVALAHGSNDVANALGPVVAIYALAKHHDLLSSVEIPWPILMIGGLGIAAGISLLGHRVIKTVGEGITKLDNRRGFSADLATATTIMAASDLGLPVSSTTAAVGAVTGVGLARGRARIDLSILRRIFLYWVLTVPISALSCMLIYWLLKIVFPQ
jgi:PiT family inorganic phosphate transporter